MGLLPGAVEFRGQVLEMRSIYQEADILVLTSEHEGTPNVILEAMACGLPVVATRVGGVPDIIQDGLTGFLVPKDDENAQLRVLLELVHNTDLRTRIGAAAQAYVETHHSLSQLPIWLQQLYEAVLERK
jgi:glycosyltransferase involved in cell wall biosynthesis